MYTQVTYANKPPNYIASAPTRLSTTYSWVQNSGVYWQLAACEMWLKGEGGPGGQGSFLKKIIPSPSYGGNRIRI